MLASEEEAATSGVLIAVLPGKKQAVARKE